jgi:aspartate ammonia-lyase
MLDLLKNGLNILINKCIKGIRADDERCKKLLEESLVSAVALVKYIGYEKAAEITKKCILQKNTLKELILEEKIMDSQKIHQILNPVEMTKPGIPGRMR